MKFSAIALGCALIGFAGSSFACSVQVSNMAELDAAISAAQPGAVICLQPGVYDAAQSAAKTVQISGKHGAVNQPISLRGQAGVEITNSGNHYGIYVIDSSYIQIQGLTVRDVKKAIMLDGSNHVSLENLNVSRVAEEAIHFRKNSSHNVLINSRVSHTGVDTSNGHDGRQRFGEAIYVGSAKSNWGSLMGSASTPDASNNNCISGNTLGPQISAETIDVKEGTRNTYILSNNFDLAGISGFNFADSALDLKGSHTYVGHNQFTNSGPTYLEKLMRIASGKDVQVDAPGKLAGKITPDAIQTHNVSTTPDTNSGAMNVIWNNTADLKSAGRPSGYQQGMLFRVDDDSGAPDPKGSRLCQGNSVGKDDVVSNIPASQCNDVPVMTACPLVLSQAMK